MGTREALNNDWRRIGIVLLIALTSMLLISSCGSSDSSDSTAASNANTEEQPKNVAEEEPEEKGSAVSTGTPGGVGRVVVNQVGFTLYTTSKDQKDSGETSCYGKCAKVWIPYTTVATPPTIMQKAKPSELGTIERTDGLTQLTYGGYPVYMYKPDEGAARVTGQGVKSFGGTWYTINPKGEIVE
ncbi:MAG TPA: hypothetical protein VFX45_01065 [Solirubrobacterales bacterium]|nr:hypothetical protein [Solirubrobacterales bacterium]